MRENLEEQYLKSVKMLKRLLKQNENLTSQEWNDYAIGNTLLSAITLMARDSIKTWEELKKKYKVGKEIQKRNIFLEIKRTRKKLDYNIATKGLSDKQTRIYSDEIDILINEYYKSKEIREYPYTSEFIEYYQESYKVLKRITKEFGEFPQTKAWNKYAKENNYLSNVSMQYIGKLDWNKLRDKIKAELNAKI